MLNKKLLAVAVLGTLAAGNAVASDLSAPGGAIPAYFAKEIIATTAAPRTLTTSASSATQLNWDIGYNFSVDEVRYARVECSSNLRFGAGTSVSSSDAAAASIGAINGLSTNVITFSLTSNNAGNLIADSDVLTVSGNHAITGTDAPVNCTVGLYDQPSQAQAGGNAGLIAGSSFSGAYLAFVPSYQLTTGSTEHVADVEADPSFSEFVPDVSTSLTQAWIGWTPAVGVNYGLRDPDGAGPQTAPFRVDGTPITMADLFAATTTITATGDFNLVANANGSFTGGALGRAWLNGNSNQVTATTARFPVGAGAFTSSALYVENAFGHLIAESEYHLTLNPVAANPTVYAVTPISNVFAGEIVRNGTQLQAPLAQVPSGWLSRLALTNTGSTARPYTIAVQGETGNTISTSNLTGTVPANGTTVIDLTTVLTGFTASPRATLNVTVAGPNNQIQGLYQIVNPDKGSISNHVLVRPGTN